MSLSLDDKILRAKELARRGDSVGAMQSADELVTQYPDSVKTWLLRGYLFELANELTPAIADISKAIQLDATEPHLFYNRGRFRFHLEDAIGSLSDFEKALELCDFYRNDYYRDELNFWRAECLLKLGRKGEFCKDILKIPDDFRTWTFALRTKQDLLEACNDLPR
jgi:tetratricopeptide (TPR) repeat protein